MDELREIMDDPVSKQAGEIAKGAAVFVAGVAFAAEVANRPSFDWTFSPIMAVTVGAAGWGLVFFVSYVLMTISRTLPEPQKITAVMQSFEPEPEPEPETEPRPVWETNLEKFLLEGRLFRIGNTIRPLPDALGTEYLYKIAQARWDGKLQTISPNALHEIGVSRFPKNGDDTAPGKIVVQFLADFGIIEFRGERQPFAWTETGERVFVTAPTPPPVTRLS